MVSFAMRRVNIAGHPRLGARLPRMDERYPIGFTATCAVHVRGTTATEPPTRSWSTTIGLRSGEATIRIPGHYAGVLAERLGARRGAVRPRCSGSRATSIST